MIPASYLFKDIYARHWEDTDAPAVVENRDNRRGGLTIPFFGAISALIDSHSARSRHSAVAVRTPC